MISSDHRASSAASPSSKKPIRLSALVQEALQAYQRGDLARARRYAEQAAQVAPQSEEPWLLLAVLASPRASLYYIGKALALNPASPRARQALQWARQRLVAQPAAPIPAPAAAPSSPELSQAAHPAVIRPAPIQKLIMPQLSLLPWLLSLLLLSLCLALLLIAPAFQAALAAEDPYLSLQLSQAWSQATPTVSADRFASLQPSAPPASPTIPPTITPTAAAPAALEPSLTPTDTPTRPASATATPFQPLPPTETPTLFPTELPWTPPPPTLTPTPLPLPRRPDIVADDERWIEVNLSLQRAYAWIGSQFVRGFIVSTGIARYPTVTGVYRIYVKYRYANMSGPGYFLRDVPYVMYFYKGYGLHGTYWHNNFGTPMSHGCVNLITEDAAWLFDWAEVGTVVAIHY